MLGAKKGGQLFVVIVDASTHEVSAMPPLPADPAHERFSGIWTTADLSRILVQLDSTDPGSMQARVLAGDGSSWRVLDADAGGGYFDTPSSQLSYVLARHSHADDQTEQAEILSFDGRSVWRAPARTTSDAAPIVAGFAPDESAFVYERTDGTLLWHTMDGAESILRVDPTYVDEGDAGVLHAFSTTLLLDDQPYPKLSLIDTQGKPIAVAGFVPDQTRILGSDRDGVWYRAGGTLYRLTDRSLQPVSPIADSVAMAALDAAGADGTVLWSDDAGTFTVTASDGSTVASLTPKDAPPPLNAAAAGVTPAFTFMDAKLGADFASVLLDVSYVVTAGDMGDELEDDEVLWTFGKGLASRVTRVWTSDPATSSATDGTRLSGDGRFLARVTGDGVLTIVDASTGVSGAVDSDYAFDTTFAR